MSRFYITNAIAYVNGDPHLGHALEFVQTDVLARHRRLRGDDVRYLSGTDENALKNVRAAEAAGLGAAEFVAGRSELFERLRAPLALSCDDFIRTSADPRHRPGVERLWRSCAAAGDLELRAYTGRYCGGCEAFLDDAELVDGVCPEHGTPPERVEERNWFFRLSPHAGALEAAISSGALAIEPEHRRNEVLALLRGGLADFSVSRPRERAGGWGIPVPGDPSQVIYVWFDALANYVTALGYGNGGGDHARWWCAAGERVHVVGKGITRFHALYWPAILRSAGEPLPTRILVHDYVTVGGRKLSKSLGGAADPAALASRYGTDALRWWVVRDVPRSGDADFREEGLARRANELADGLGNLVSRTVSLAARGGGNSSNWHSPRTPIGTVADPGLAATIGAVPASVDAALARFDLRAAAAVWGAVEEANRFVSARRPWELEGEARAAVLADALAACAAIGAEIAPFLRRRRPGRGRARVGRPGGGAAPLPQGHMTGLSGKQISRAAAPARSSHMTQPIADRIAALDWPALQERLDEDGFVQTPPVLSASERRELAGSFDGGRFRSTIEMRRHRFGEGTYRYFDHPLPEPIAAARSALYPPLAETANRWAERLGEPADLPADHDGFLDRCHHAGQERPTPLILRYGEGGHNALHQDIYGDVAFPLQAVTLLSSIGDFAGGQFVLVEGRPRQQSRAHVIDLDPGAFLVFPTRTRPVQGTRGFYRAAMRHGVATVLGGERTTLGIIFHDAA